MLFAKVVEVWLVAFFGCDGFIVHQFPSTSSCFANTCGANVQYRAALSASAWWKFQCEQKRRSFLAANNHIDNKLRDCAFEVGRLPRSSARIAWQESAHRQRKLGKKSGALIVAEPCREPSLIWEMYRLAPVS